VRFTIERIRTVILVAGVLLVVALGVFLTIGRWRSPLSRRDLPKKLGIDIQQEENGFTHAEFHAGHALFKITASKVEQLKNKQVRLHSVKIETYDAKSGGTDSIEGSEFEYDQGAGIASAAGPVEITLERPRSAQPGAATKPGKDGAGPISSPAPDQIHVKTTGLVFNQNTGVASSSQHVEFALPQGWGSAMGASFDSQKGVLVLPSAVDIHSRRGADTIEIQAQHAEFDRSTNLCELTEGIARYRGGATQASQATVRFRADGTAAQLDVASGFVLTTASGGRLGAPRGSLAFDTDNQPTAGHLEGGVTLDMVSESRKVHGTAPTANLQFGPGGDLRLAHLERGVQFASEEETGTANAPIRARRAWASPVADVMFRRTGKGPVELDSLHGLGGVVLTSETQRGAGTPARARMTADEVTGNFGANSALTAMTGVGHATMEQTSETGTHQTTSGDRLDAHFTGMPAADGPRSGKVSANARSGTAAGQIQSATVLGHVVLVQQAATSGRSTSAALRATAERADYEGAGEWLHLTGNPHVENGSLDIDADKIDVARASGDAFAHGDVKATWFGDDGRGVSGSPEPFGRGTQSPAHVVAAEAQVHQATGEATFRGQARLWQEANSIAAPLIVLDHVKQTLVARATNAGDPVRVVVVSAGAAGQGKASKPESPSVIRVRGGELKYSDAERKAVMQGGNLGAVVAQTGEATTRSDEVELVLLPPGNHAASDGRAAQVDRMTARGGVILEVRGRRGTGDKLDYSGERGTYVLTGSAATPPRIVDPERGTVTGESLIFNSRDDSVSVEGNGRGTATETAAPKRP
jgi:lipopolysaccharide export system protein LptA